MADDWWCDSKISAPTISKNYYYCREKKNPQIGILNHFNKTESMKIADIQFENFW